MRTKNQNLQLTTSSAHGLKPGDHLHMPMRMPKKRLWWPRVVVVRSVASPTVVDVESRRMTLREIANVLWLKLRYWR